MSSTRSEAAEFTERRYLQVRADVARHLRETADKIERDVPTNLRDLLPDYFADFYRVLHDVTWGVANLNVDGLLDPAKDAYLAVRGFGEWAQFQGGADDVIPARFLRRRRD